MRKIRRALSRDMPKLVVLLLALVLISCAGAKISEVLPPLSSPEADLFAPGMIPPECEDLFQKSQTWGYRPGVHWQPANAEQAIEVAKFFASFSIVPEKTSQFLRHWSESARPHTDGEAQEILNLMSRAQSCDVFLPQSFFEALIAYPWKKSERAQFSKSLLAFIANQQSRTSFLLPRAMSLFLFHQGVKRGLIRVQGGGERDLVSLQKWLEQKRAEAQAALGAGVSGDAPPSALQIERSMWEEMQISEQLREKISRYLPLP